MGHLFTFIPVAGSHITAVSIYYKYISFDLCDIF